MTWKVIRLTVRTKSLFLYNPSRSCLWLFFTFTFCDFFKNSLPQQDPRLSLLYFKKRPTSNISHSKNFYLSFFKTKKMNPRTLDPSLKKNTPIPNKEFEFQPEPKRSSREKGSIRLGPRIRGYAILTSLSSGERKKKSSCRSLYPSPLPKILRRGGLTWVPFPSIWEILRRDEGCPKLLKITSLTTYMR